jgi:polysaccharide export outer membrane protein
MISRNLKLLAVAVSIALTGCSTFLPSSGPSASDVVETPDTATESGIKVVELSQAMVRRAITAQQRASLPDVFGAGVATVPKLTIGPGDAVEVSIWEAPPGALFGSSPLDPRMGGASSRMTTLPEQMVNASGYINVPFAGSIRALGRTPQEVEEDIARRLKSKANDPQVLVRLLRNATSTVTLMGEVNNSARLPLTARGERLLDALAAAGGFRQPVGKITIRITREVTEQGRRSTRVVSLPLESIITDPTQNIVLQPGDVITALHQPNSLTVLGATARNEELNFEAQGITLAQALARAGGVQDQRANPGGVFIFRFEDPAMLGGAGVGPTTADGKVPVVYRVDLRDPATFFLAQDFPMRNKDVMYVANAPAAELQKFMNLLSTVVVPVLTIRSVTD